MADKGYLSSKQIENLLAAIEDVYLPDRQLIWKSFIKGLFFGLGTTLGASLVLALVTFILKKLEFIPILGEVIKRTDLQDVISK